MSKNTTTHKAPPAPAEQMNAAGFATFGSWNFERQGDGSWFGFSPSARQAREFATTGEMRGWMKAQ